MEVIRVDVSTDVVNFWNGLKVYYEQPKCINKQVLCSEVIFSAELMTSVSVSECQTLINSFCVKLSEEKNLKLDMRTKECLQLNILTGKNLNKLFLSQKGMYLHVRRLIPKLSRHVNLNFYEFIFLDKFLLKAFIFTKIIPIQFCEGHVCMEHEEQDPYIILKFNFLQLNWYSKFVEIFYNEDLSERGITWLKAVFIPKFEKLLNSGSHQMTKKKLSKLQFDSKIDIVQYYQLYEKMKLKYGKYFTENWIENTDPKKFVYEDIGIATYLIMLWNQGKVPGENMKKHKFVDLGCGNGLLVHILNAEGHLGIGLDIRKRKIWDTYPLSTVLKEQTVIPATETTYPDADWLIGNHSDELTAWIPIMARLSNAHCQYFVLPCCPYELNGKKFQRKNSSLSCYQDFINYVKCVSEVCGFETYVDKLRIPSTKRICLIGSNNPEMSKHMYSSFVENIIGFVKKEIPVLGFGKAKNHAKSEDQVSRNFKLRKSVEVVRNCTRLPQGFIENALKTVMNELLRENIICTVIKEGKCYTWNRGGKLSIKELASCIEEKLMKQLKNECKGLQTLLKNQHFLFEVNQGYVQFRKPESMLVICNKISTSQDKGKWKKKKCWFFNNHPDGCPLAHDVCSYKHERGQKTNMQTLYKSFKTPYPFPGNHGK